MQAKKLEAGEISRTGMYGVLLSYIRACAATSEEQSWQRIGDIHRRATAGEHHVSLVGRADWF